MQETVNFILENWQPLGASLITLIGIVFGVKARKKLNIFTKEVSDICWTFTVLVRDINNALDDKKISKEEIHEIKLDLLKLKKKFLNLIDLFI